MASRIALRVNAAVGMVTTVLAAATMWLALTQPAQVVTALADRAYGEMLMAVAHQLLGWTQAVLRFF